MNAPRQVHLSLAAPRPAAIPRLHAPRVPNLALWIPRNAVASVSPCNPRAPTATPLPPTPTPPTPHTPPLAHLQLPLPKRVVPCTLEGRPRLLLHAALLLLLLLLHLPQPLLRALQLLHHHLHLALARPRLLRGAPAARGYLRPGHKAVGDAAPWCVASMDSPLASGPCTPDEPGVISLALDSLEIPTCLCRACFAVLPYRGSDAALSLRGDCLICPALPCPVGHLIT